MFQLVVICSVMLALMIAAAIYQTLEDNDYV